MKKPFKKIVNVGFLSVVLFFAISIIHTQNAFAYEFYCYGQGIAIHDILCGSGNTGFCCIGWSESIAEVDVWGCCA